MTGSVGILAYGSLLEVPGEEIEKATVRVVRDVKTPFKVEFARSSIKRSGAPTLVPDERGREVGGRIVVVGVPLAEARNRLYRREMDEVGGERVYKEPKKVGDNTVVIKSLADLGGIETVLYTDIRANIEPLRAEKLAELA